MYITLFLALNRYHYIKILIDHLGHNKIVFHAFEIINDIEK